MHSKYWLISLSVAGLSVYLAERTNLMLPFFVRFYLNDSIIVPLTALVARTLMRFLFSKPKFILKIGEVVYIVVFYSVVFELVLPYFMHRYKADYVDVMMYALGGVLYWYCINKR